MGSSVNNKTQGAALITVLIIVFIVTAIITNITISNYRILKRLSNQRVMNQAYATIYAGVDFGRAGLATSATTSQIDALTDIWAQPLPKTTVLDNINLSGYITDEQSKFNINDLVQNGVVNSKAVAEFSVLLSYLNIPPAMANSIAYYMAQPQYQNEIMSQYTGGNPAYRPAARPLVDISELLLIKGMQQNWLYTLKPFITAIPQNISNSTNSIPVNVNTASAEVISAKSGIPLPIAERIVTLRNTTPFQTTQDIMNFLNQNGIMTSQNSGNNSTNIQIIGYLSTNSNYFTIHAIVDSGDYEFKWVALVYRAIRNGQWPQILWQHPE